MLQEVYLTFVKTTCRPYHLCLNSSYLVACHPSATNLHPVQVRYKNKQEVIGIGTSLSVQNHHRHHQQHRFSFTRSHHRLALILQPPPHRLHRSSSLVIILARRRSSVARHHCRWLCSLSSPTFIVAVIARRRCCRSSSSSSLSLGKLSLIIVKVVPHQLRHHCHSPCCCRCLTWFVISTQNHSVHNQFCHCSKQAEALPSSSSLSSHKPVQEKHWAAFLFMVDCRDYLCISSSGCRLFGNLGLSTMVLLVSLSSLAIARCSCPYDQLAIVADRYVCVCASLILYCVIILSYYHLSTNA